jgi:zinc protease
MKTRLSSAILLAGLWAASALGQAAGKPEKITSVEGITEYRLSNGLSVLLFPDPTKATITVNITYKVGSRNENYGETGMAHLLEHLMFKGSTHHPNVTQELTAHGARPNGTTWYDRTNYYETFQASDENLKWALDLEADRMVNSFIAKKDLDSEMTVVRNEYEAGENDPSGILQERVLSTAYLWHNYGKDTIGARSDIENVPIDRLQAFWRTYYQPDNAVLLVAGKFDPDKTLALIQELYGKIPKPARVIQTTYTVEPTQDGERSVTRTRPPSRCSPRSWATRPPAASTRPSWRPRRPRAWRASSSISTTRAF